MTDKEYENEIMKIKEAFDKWLDEQDNLLEISISESLGNAFFAGYELASKALQLN